MHVFAPQNFFLVSSFVALFVDCISSDPIMASDEIIVGAIDPEQSRPGREVRTVDTLAL